MLFMSPKPRRFLLENGMVYTVRAKKRKLRGEYIGHDWITDRRGGRKIADVIVEHWMPIDKDSLETVLTHYVRWSGFLTVTEWINEIKKFNGGKLPRKLHLYRVTLIKPT